MSKSIYFFHPSSELYGSDKILTYIVKCYPNYEKTIILKNRGPLIDLLAKECPDVKVEIISSLPIIAKKNLKPKGIISFLISLFKFKTALKRIYKQDPYIIYLNTLATIPILFYYRKQIKIIHVHEILSNTIFFNKIVNLIALKYADTIICVSNAVLRNLETAKPKYKEKLKLVRNGINFSKPDELNSGFNFKIDVNKINFALIGRIKPSHKGQKLLLNAISKLPISILQQSHFYFIGSPVQGQEYMLNDVKKTISELRLQDFITIIPFVKEIERVYQKIDVVTVPSTVEDSLPTTVLEGMFFSKPIIGTRIGGIPEMIEDEVSGFITNRDDAEDLSKKIMIFINNPSEIKRMGENGRKLFINNFSEESFYQRYNNVINNILSKE
ncbi:MAG: glycosyltransferase family 4 protein [Dysgonomonas sp.]